MHSSGLPFSSDQLQDHIPPMDIAFVFEVYNDFSCMCAVHIHNKWYKQHIILRDIVSLREFSTIKYTHYELQHQTCFNLMQDLMLFRNLSLCNVSYGNNGALIADVEIAGLHINDKINTCVDRFNNENRIQYEQSAKFKLKRWLQQCVARIRQTSGI